MGTGHRQNAGMRSRNIFRIGAQTACHDHFAILVQRFPDRLEAFSFGAVQKAAGVYNHRVSAGIIGRYAIALGSQSGKNPLAINKRFWTTEGHHADGWLTIAKVFLQLCTDQIRSQGWGVCRHNAPIAYANGLEKLAWTFRWC